MNKTMILKQVLLNTKSTKFDIKMRLLHDSCITMHIIRYIGAAFLKITSTIV